MRVRVPLRVPPRGCSLIGWALLRTMFSNTNARTVGDVGSTPTAQKRTFYA